MSTSSETRQVNRELRIGKAKINIAYGVPQGAAEDCIFLAHGVKSSMKSSTISYLHNTLAKRGFLTVKFNFPFAERRWFETKRANPKNVLVQCYRYVIEDARQSEWKPKNLFLGGLSLGAAIASHVIADGPEVPDARGIFFLSYPLHFPKKPDTLTDSHLEKINLPMLFISGNKDVYADEQALRSSISRLGSRARLQILEADHSLNSRRGQEMYLKTLSEVAGIVGDWAVENS